MPESSAGGIVLCGGKSSRMGYPKALLPFGNETLLARVVRILSEIVSPVIVVAAPNQHLPRLASNARIVEDRHEGRGPLEGLRAGLEEIQHETDLVYATSCDAPFISLQFVRRVLQLADEHDIAIPMIEGYAHPMSAAYRITVLPVIIELLAANQLRPFFLLNRVRAREIKAGEFIDVDPGLENLRNLNRPADYLAAAKEMGFTVPQEILAALNKTQ